MKKQIMAVTLTAAMLAGLAAVPVWADDAGSDEGKVLNIYCWNEEFKSRLTDHYPGYEEVDGTHGKIGDVDVVWNITPSDDNAYQNNLDETLLKQADAAADDKIEITTDDILAGDIVALEVNADGEVTSLTILAYGTGSYVDTTEAETDLAEEALLGDEASTEAVTE